MRPGSLGHHQSFQREERFTQWHHEYFGDLVHILGAMAAEHVFYGENASGVSGDLESATNLTATMSGIAAMGLQRMDDESSDEARERYRKRFAEIGLYLMNRTRGSADAHADPIASIIGDPFKREISAAILGQAFVTAYNFIRENKAEVERLADVLVEKRELYGDELIETLDAQNFRKPVIDYSKDETWPRM
jgi:ATP-dependent Zn protease